MSDPSKLPVDLSAADMTALRYLAVVWGGIIAATWLMFDDVRTQLVMTGVQLTLLAATLGSIYLLRRWRNRR